jgi:hypothetical protein
MRLGFGGTAKAQFMSEKKATRPALRVGQVWRTREGEEVTLEETSLNYPFAGSNDTTYTSSGFVWDDEIQDPRDLTELISDAAATTPDPVPPAEPWPLPRLFAAPIHRTCQSPDWMVLDAIADDGTAWYMVVCTDPATEAPAPYWRQIPPLPQPEAE